MPREEYKTLIKAFLIAVAVLLTADFAVDHSWPSDLTTPSAPPRVYADGDGRSGPRQASAIYYWRGAVMRPTAADAAPFDCPSSCPGRRGMIVAKVIPGSPAARAGLKPGDIVVGLDAFPVTTPRSLAFAVADHTGGPVVRLRVWRQAAGGAVPLSLLIPPDRGRERATPTA